jgi:hypothetical protein
MLVIHKSGSVEVNCGLCKRGVIVPLKLLDGPVELRKAVLTAKKGLTGGG